MLYNVVYYAKNSHAHRPSELEKGAFIWQGIWQKGNSEQIVPEETSTQSSTKAVQMKLLPDSTVLHIETCLLQSSRMI